MAENEDQPWNDENIEDPWPAQRPQRVRQPPVRFGYNQPGNPALFCQAVNTNLQPWQMTPYPQPMVTTTTAILVTDRDAVPLANVSSADVQRLNAVLPPLDQ